MSIYVANINYEAKESDVRKLFEPFGQVKSVKILTDKESRKSRGLGFVHMETEEESQEAIKGLNGSSFMERTLIVKVANERKPTS